MDRLAMLAAYNDVRRCTESLCAPLEREDYVVQPIPDVSPPKWHLGHTSWFFEQLVLEKFRRDYRPVDRRYYFVFNSYYQSFGDRVRRDRRGTLSRPTVEAVYRYRAAIDDRMRELLTGVPDGVLPQLWDILELGLNHEQQHEELLVTDIKGILASNPLIPAYRELNPDGASVLAPLPRARFIGIEGGLFQMGASGEGFAFDNERPKHPVFVGEFQLMDRLVSCGEYLEFMEDGGYRNPLLWLSDGWDAICREGWEAPEYWEKIDGAWCVRGLQGVSPINADEPVSHVSYYEAEAYARWAGKRLPREEEWEKASLHAVGNASAGNFMEEGRLRPAPLDPRAPGPLKQMFGDVWEWTASAYLPYPGYQQAAGALGEYNGKFMANQMVLRGGSCATPRSHFRPTYRNFFQCDKRWQFTGLRLASDS